MSPTRQHLSWRQAIAAGPLLPILAILLLGQAALGCSSKEHWNWHWEYFVVDKEELAEEREKLADVVQDVLVHRRFYLAPSERFGEAGRDEVLVTDWNEEDAMILQGSYSGTRTRVAVRLTEGLERSQHFYPQNEADRRLLASAHWDDPRDTETILSLGIATKRERNTRMNYIPGEHRNAEWRPDGVDERLMQILVDQIKSRFREVSSREQPEPGDMSPTTQRIYEERDRRDETEREDSPYGAIGPGTSSGGSGLSFGTNHGTQ